MIFTGNWLQAAVLIQEQCGVSASPRDALDDL